MLPQNAHSEVSAVDVATADHPSRACQTIVIPERSAGTNAACR